MNCSDFYLWACSVLPSSRDSESNLVTGKFCLVLHCRLRDRFCQTHIYTLFKIECVVRQEFSMILNSPNIWQGVILIGCPSLVLGTKVSSVTVSINSSFISYTVTDGENLRSDFKK